MGAVLVARATLFRPDPVPVTVFRVAPGRVEATVTNSKAGTIKTRRRGSLSPEVGGRVEALPVAKGDRVTTGQVLLRIASTDLAAQVRLQQRSLEAARAAAAEGCGRLAQSERELARARSLAEEKIVSTDFRERV